jgi:chemotaxis response regulator CheB
MSAFSRESHRSLWSSLIARKVNYVEEGTAPRAVIAVGASAGGVTALQTLVSHLPTDLPAAVLVVLHVPATGPSALPLILERAGSLRARHALDGEPVREGEILIAPPTGTCAWSMAGWK